jgi:hypothetical protein
MDFSLGDEPWLTRLLQGGEGPVDPNRLQSRLGIEYSPGHGADGEKPLENGIHQVAGK